MIDFIFNIINLVVFVILLVFIVKKYVYPELLESLRIELEEADNLSSKKLQLIHAQETVKKNIYLQEKKSEGLHQKIDQWVYSVNLINNAHKKELQKRQLLLNEKIKAQSSKYFLRSAKEEITTDVINKLRVEFTNYFESEDRIREFFGRLICNMQKGEECRENQKHS